MSRGRAANKKYVLFSVAAVDMKVVGRREAGGVCVWCVGCWLEIRSFRSRILLLAARSRKYLLYRLEVVSSSTG